MHYFKIRRTKKIFSLVERKLLRTPSCSHPRSTEVVHTGPDVFLRSAPSTSYFSSSPSGPRAILIIVHCNWSRQPGINLRGIDFRWWSNLIASGHYRGFSLRPSSRRLPWCANWTSISEIPKDCCLTSWQQDSVPEEENWPRIPPLKDQIDKTMTGLRELHRSFGWVNMPCKSQKLGVEENWNICLLPKASRALLVILRSPNLGVRVPNIHFVTLVLV